MHALGRLAREALQGMELVFEADDAAARWEQGGSALVDILALDAVSLLRDPEMVRRIEACDECGWVFIDTTRNRSRRWCDPADCGNRARQRRHYRRHRQR